MLKSEGQAAPRPYKLYRRIQLPIERALSLCMCRQFGAIAVAGDSTLGLVDLETNTLKHTVSHAHAEPIIQVCSDGDCTLATISFDRLLSLWRVPAKSETEADTITKIGSIALPSQPSCCAIIPNSGNIAVGCENSLLLIDSKSISFEKKGKRRSQVGLSALFAKTHWLHAADITTVAFSRDGQFVLSGDVEGNVTVASVVDMPSYSPYSDGSMNEEIEIAEARCFRAGYCVEECVASLKHIEKDIIFATTSSDHVAAFRAACLTGLEGQQEGDCVVLSRSAAVRNYPALWEEGTAPSIVTALFEPTTSRAFVLVSSVTGRLVLFNIDREVTSFVSFQTTPELPVGHTTLVRASEYCGSGTIVTCGDDGRLCIWKLMTGDTGRGHERRERQRLAPY